MSLIVSGTKITYPDGSLSTYGVIPGAIMGLTLSTAGSSSTFSVASGRATDSTYAVSMNLSASISKTTSSWAVGTSNGALDTGTIANSTWYHVFEISTTDLSVVDILISTSATSPTMPGGYTYKRRIGSMKTNGSAQWTSFLQDGDFFFIAAITDFSAGGTSAMTLRTLSVPTGITVKPLLTVYTTSVNNTGTRIYGAPAANSSLSTHIGYDANGNAGGTYTTANCIGPTTNTSGQIYIQVSEYSNGGSVITYGWLDTRGLNE